MAKRPRQSEKDQNKDLVDLGESIGLTLLSNSKNIAVSDWLPTGIPSLDYILGGGIPFGRVTEVYGKNSAGKSVLGVTLTKQAQRYGVPVLWIDVEGTTTAETMLPQGADPEKIFVYQPDEGEYITIEDVTEKLKEVIQKFGEIEQPLLVIWDSLASTATKQQLKDGFNPNQIGVVAKAITNMTTQIGQGINETNIAFVILNQARDDLNANPMFPTIKSSGGRAMEHWASLRLEVQKASQLKEKVYDPVTGKEKDDYVGHIFRLKTKKSKVSTPNRQAETFLISAPFKGLDFVENVYRSSVEQYGFISKGAWRKYQPEDGSDIINLRHTEWVPFLESEEGQPILEELYIKQMLQVFPDSYAPLHNEKVDVTVNPYLAKLADIYDQRAQEADNEDAPEEEIKEEETE